MPAALHVGRRHPSAASLSRSVAAFLRSFALIVPLGCGVAGGNDGDSEACAPWAVDVVAFAPGEGAGFGDEDLPGVVLGPPHGGKSSQGSLDVVSLGTGGTITLALGCPAVDDDGPDLFVYENPFVVAGGDRVFVDPAEVAVSDDGDEWSTWPCEPPAGPVAEDDGEDGCAGLSPVAANADHGLHGLADGGGDAFDLATVGIERARFVRVTDRSTSGAAPNAGFDLDAVAAAER